MASGPGNPALNEETTLDEIEASPTNQSQPGEGKTGSGLVFDPSEDDDLGGFNQGGSGIGSLNTQGEAYSIPDLEASRGAIKTIAPAWRYIAIMPKIDKQLTSPLSTGDAGASYNSARKLSSSNIPIAVCSNVEIPPVTIDTDQRFGAATKIYVARFINYAMINISFYEDEDYSVSKYLWAWHMSVRTKDNLFYLPKDFKKDIKVWGFNDRSNSSPAIMIDFIECFPSMSGSGLTYGLAENNFLTVSAEFTVDLQSFGFAT